MLTYEAAKSLDPTKVFEALGLKHYYKDSEYKYYQVTQVVVELGLRHKKTVEFRLAVDTAYNGYYVFYYNNVILYLPELVALLKSETLNLATTNLAITKALSFIESVND